MTRSTADDIRRKRLRFHAWHRGMKEMDLILGRFADAHIEEMSAVELDAFEAVLGLQDPDLQAWLMGRVPLPVDHTTAMLGRIMREFAVRE